MRPGRQFCVPKTKFPSFLIKPRPNLFPKPPNPRPPCPPHSNLIFLHDAASQRFFHRRSEGHGAPAAIQDTADASEVHDDHDNGDTTRQDVDFSASKR